MAWAAIAWPGACAAVERVLVVGSEQDYPPFAIGSTDATADGFTVELWQAVAKQSELSYRIQVRPLDELLQAFKSGTVDVLINLAQSDARRGFADFSVTHVAVHGGIFVRSDEHRIQSESDLGGKSIIVLKGDLAHDYALGKGWQTQLTLVDTAEQGLRLLASGKHDAFLLGKLTGQQLIRNTRLQGVRALDADAGFVQRFSFAVHKGDAELLARINEGLALVKADGSYDRIHEKWFGIYENKPRDWREAWPFLAAALLVCAIVAAGIGLRRRQRDRRVAKELRESEERWKFAIEGAGDGVWDADLAAGKTLYSPRWKQILGYESDEVGDAPHEWTDRIHPDDRSRVLLENRLCLEGATNSFVSEFRMRTKDGRWIWILDRAKVVDRSAGGRALRMIGTHTDISDRKTTQAREEAHAKVMTLIATDAPLAEVLERIVLAVEAITGWQCSILLVDHGGTRLVTGAAPSLPERFSAGIDGRSIGPEEGTCGAAAFSGVRQITQDIGTDRRWTKFRALAMQAGFRACWSEPIVGSAGLVLGSFAAYHRQTRAPNASDLSIVSETARMASIAIERKRSEQALRASEERLQRALEASRLALWDIDLASGDVFLSDAWSEMMGRPRQPTRTTFDDLVALVPDEDQLRIAGAMGDALRGTTSSYRVEHQVRRTDGQLLWVLSQGKVVERGADGRARRAVGTNLDITEGKRAEAAREQLEARLREAQKLEAIGTLAGGIAHDFNNIMAAVLGNVSLAQLDEGSSPSTRVHLQQINKAGQRARSLVQQILAFSRDQPTEFAGLSLRPVVEETLAMLRPMVGSSTELRIELPEQALQVMGNATQLQQVLMNLGTNAWHALPGGAGFVEIGLEAVARVGGGSARPPDAEGGSFAHLWVRDNGCGMDEQTRQHIFEPFFTTKPVGQGTGLGLAVAHGIVETHKGSFEVETAVGRGTTVHLYLPLVDPVSGFVDLPPDRSESPRGQGQNVLYIDDDEVMAQMVESLLERLGYRATCMLDARQALQLVEHELDRFDVVVTDFNMPDLSGLDVVRKLAELRPDLPVVISSGYIADELRSSAARLRVRALMQKERTFDELGAVLHSALKADA